MGNVSEASVNVSFPIKKEREANPASKCIHVLQMSKKTQGGSSSRVDLKSCDKGVLSNSHP